MHLHIWELLKLCIYDIHYIQHQNLPSVMLCIKSKGDTVAMEAEFTCYTSGLFISYSHFLASVSRLSDQRNFHVLGKDVFKVW